MSTLEHLLGGYAASPERTAPEVGTPLSTSGANWPERVEHLSASSLAMFVVCPEQWRQRYVLGKKVKPGEGMLVGSMLHLTLEHNYVQKIASFEDLPLAEAVEYHNDVSVPTALSEHEEIAWDDPTFGPESARQDSERMTVAYLKQVVPRVQPVEVESRFTLEVPGLHVPLIGYTDVTAGMDRGDGAWEPSRIIDTKTGKQSHRKLKPSWNMQATIYSAALNLPVEYHSISRAATPKITTALESDEMVKNPNLMEAAAIYRTAAQVGWMISEMYAKYGPDETWPTLGALPSWNANIISCKFCGYRRDCPAGQAL